MKGVFGALIIFLGLVMGYLILTGKLPNSGQLIKAQVSNASTNQSGQTPPNPKMVQKLIQTNSEGSGPGGPFGLPVLAHSHDWIASRGGMN